jgi:hypothetical protein
MRAFAFLLFAVFAAGCAGAGGGSVPAKTPTQSASSGFKIPAKISAAVPPAPPAMTPPKLSSNTRRTSSGGTHPAFFAGETALSNGVYYLTLPNGNVFGYYTYLTDPNYIYHFDMGFEYMSDPSDGHGGIYFYDDASGHWWYTARDYEFPYLYDFTLNTTLYYYPDTQNAGHYTTNPRYFYNFATSKIINLPDPRVHIWGLGDTYGLPTQNQGPDEPVWSGTQPSCDSDGQCAAGGTGSVSFHVARPNTTTVPAAEYRNMMLVEKVIDSTNYAFNYELAQNTVYDVRFQTVYRMQPDAQYVQSLIWQDHDRAGNVQTSLGIANHDGAGMTYFLNCGESGGIGDFFPWYSEVVSYGHVDTWEIQFKNTSDASGWVDLYRNGVKQHHCDGRTVTTDYDILSFGIYYYNWEIPRSTVLSQDMTFNSFDLSSIPGPVAPL